VLDCKLIFQDRKSLHEILFFIRNAGERRKKFGTIFQVFYEYVVYLNHKWGSPKEQGFIRIGCRFVSQEEKGRHRNTSINKVRKKKVLGTSQEREQNECENKTI